MKTYKSLAITIIIIAAITTANGQLVGKWTFNENAGTVAYDLSGNNLNGTLVNYVSYITSPGTDAITLDGIEKYVTFGTNSNFAITGAYSIEAWVRLRGVTGEAWVLGKDTAVYGISCYNNKFYAYGGSTGNNNISFTPGLNQWVHVVATSDPAGTGDTLKLYADGVLVASKSSIGLYPPSNADLPLLCGIDRNKNSFLNADIDELRLYNNAMSQAEVAASYNAGASKYAIQNCTDVKAKGYQLAEDISGDCDVDLEDFSLMAKDWLECNNPQGCN